MKKLRSHSPLLPAALCLAAALLLPLPPCSSTAHAQPLEYVGGFPHGGLGADIVRLDSSGTHMYVGTFEEIRVFALSGASWTPVQTFSDASVSDFVDFQLSPDGANAYATANLLDTFDPGAVFVFAVSAADGSLSLIQEVSSLDIPVGLNIPGELAVTEQNLYTTSFTAPSVGSLVVFERLPDGTISFIEEEGAGTGALGIVGAGTVEVVGSQVYVAGIEKKIAVFDAVPGGGVDWRGTVDLGTQGSDIIDSVAVSPDGAFLYVSRPDCQFGGPCGGDAIDVLSRDTTTGDLTLVQTLLNGVDISGVAQPRELAVSPDGRWLVVTAASPGTLTVFDIQAAGTLLQTQQFQGGSGALSRIIDISAAHSVILDPGAGSAYVAGLFDDSIQRFDFAETRLPGAGMLKLKLNAKGKRGINIAWKKGDSVALGDLGDPVSGGTVYHITLISGQTQVNYSIPPGAFSKSDGEGWKALPNGKGFLYKAKPGVNPTGITKMKLLVGENGKSKVIVVGKGNDAKGINLPLPPMPPTTAARVLISNGITVWDMGAPSGRYNPNSGVYLSKF